MSPISPYGKDLLSELSLSLLLNNSLFLLLHISTLHFISRDQISLEKIFLKKFIVVFLPSLLTRIIIKFPGIDFL